MRGLPGSRNSDPAVEQLYDEEVCLFDREHICPVCGRGFTAKSVRAGKVISDGMDIDMRPRSKNLDMMKYRVLECPICGYANLERYFRDIRKKEVEALREKCLRWDTQAEAEEGARSYEEAHHYYKAAIRCNLVRGAKNSIRAYTALCASWLLRGWREELETKGKKVEDNATMGKDEERKLVKYAANNFKEALANEDFPICGMEEPTFDYLMAVLTYKQGNCSDAQRYVIRALQSRLLKPAIRPMAEDLRDMIKANEPID